MSLPTQNSEEPDFVPNRRRRDGYAGYSGGNGSGIKWSTDVPIIDPTTTVEFNSPDNINPLFPINYYFRAALNSYIFPTIHR